MYEVLRQHGDNNYTLGDPATKREISTFAQPVHVSQLVPLELVHEDLDNKDVVYVYLVIENVTGVIQEMAIDGRVRVTYNSRDEEDLVHRLFLKAKLRDFDRGGLWIDLLRVNYDYQ